MVVAMYALNAVLVLFLLCWSIPYGIRHGKPHWVYGSAAQILMLALTVFVPSFGVLFIAAPVIVLASAHIAAQDSRQHRETMAELDAEHDRLVAEIKEEWAKLEVEHARATEELECARTTTLAAAAGGMSVGTATSADGSAASPGPASTSSEGTSGVWPEGDT
jgi:hypothetical protein